MKERPLSFLLTDNAFNYSHQSFLKMGSMIPQLNPHALWKLHLVFKNQFA